MTPEQKRAVQDTFAQVAPRARQASHLFYERLFSIDPTARLLFPDDMNEQERKLIVTLDVMVVSVDRLEEFLPIVYELGQHHIKYGVTDTHYTSVGAALLWTLEQMLGETYTADVALAWQEMYALVADTMRAAAAHI